MNQLSIYLGTKGQYGKCPDWYALMQAAKYINVAPWDLMKQSVWWRLRSQDAMTAEIEGQKIADQRGNR